MSLFRRPHFRQIGLHQPDVHANTRRASLDTQLRRGSHASMEGAASWTTWTAIAAGGALGAMLRYGVVEALLRLAGADFPWGIVAANWIGSFCIALLAVAAADWFRGAPEAKLFLLVGLLGSFTTFSTFSLDNLYFLQRGQVGLFLLYAVGSAGGGLLLAWLGYALGRWWKGA